MVFKRFLYVLTLSALTSSALAKQAATIEVSINSANNDIGKVRIYLMTSAAEFDGKKIPYSTCESSIKKQRARCIFKNVPYGDYAFFTFHDENSNDELDTNFLGAPKEKLAVSLVDLAQNQEPTFEQARFTINRPDVTYFINLQ